MAATATGKKLLVAGEWIETGEWIEVTSPYSGEVVARVAKAGAQHVRKRARRRGGRARGAASRPQARRDPGRRRGRARPPPGGGRADDLRRGRQAAQDREGRGLARHVHLHDGRGRGAQAHRRDGADGRLPGRRGQARVHAPPPDRDRRRDQPVQLPAQPGRAQARARARRRLPGGAEAGDRDAAVGAPARGADDRGGPASGLALRRRRELGGDRRRARRGRAREADHLHRLRPRRLGAARAGAAQAGQPRARQRDPGDRRGRRRPRRGGRQARGKRVLLRRPELHLGAADLRRAARSRAVPRAVPAEGRGARRRRPGRRGDRRRPADRRRQPRPRPRLDRGGARRRRRGPRRRRRRRTGWSGRP